MMEEENKVLTPRTYMTTEDIESKERKLIKENYQFFGLASILYAVFYTFCVYKNADGITLPLLQVGTLSYYIILLRKLGFELKKGSYFYMVSILLLGLSIFLTDDWKINILSKTAIFVLLVIFILHQLYEDSKWTIGKYLASFAVLGLESIAAIPFPFADAARAVKEKQKKEDGKIKYILIGLGIAVPLTLLIMALLLSADAIFANIFADMIDGLKVFQNIFSICLTALFAYIGIYCFINGAAKKNIKEEVKDQRILEPLIANTFLGVISVVYVMFCAVQIMGLFAASMKLPEHYSYAQYAREGFFQLLFVCAINILIVLCCMAFFKESKALKGLLTLISVCTYIMVASSVYRMLLYVQIYHFTFLRLFVLWSLLVIALLMAGIMVCIYRESFPLFRYCLTVVTAAYIVFAFSHPDYLIASYNINAIEKAEKEEFSMDYGGVRDFYYLTSLSADAAKALASYEGETLTSYGEDEDSIRAYFNKIKEKSEKLTPRTFNVSRYIAGNIAKEYLK